MPKLTEMPSVELLSASSTVEQDHYMSNLGATVFVDLVLFKYIKLNTPLINIQCIENLYI
jgi:hypothetical protein